MADAPMICTLRTKRDEIENAIAHYTKKIREAQCDLAHINATLRLFETQDERSDLPVYVDTKRLFPHGAIVAISKKALAEEGPLDTRELALRVIRASGLEETDKVLRTSVAYRIVQAMRLQAKRGNVKSPGTRGCVRMWALP
jgi:hypothetical protein